MTPPPKTTHPLLIFSGSANCPLAEEVAGRLGMQLGCCVTQVLPDTESHDGNSIRDTIRLT